MPLAQDQFRQKTRKIYESQFHLKEDTSKQLNADPKDLWQVKLICEEGKSASGNDSEADDSVVCKKAHFKCTEDRHFDDEETVLRKGCPQPKNVRFEQFSSGEYTSPDNDYSDPEEPEDRRCCIETRGEGKRSHEKEHRIDEHCCHVCDVTECRKHKAKVRAAYGCEMRMKGVAADKMRGRGSKEEFESVMRRLSPRGKVHSKGCSEYVVSRARPPYGVDCEEKMHRCGEWCNRYQQDEPRAMCERSQKSPIHMLKYSKPYKHVHHVKKDKLSEVKWKKEKEEQMYHSKPERECCHHAKQKKKVLDSYEELPAVDESLEERSDATYKASSYTKFPKMTGGEGQVNFAKERSGDRFREIYDTNSSWVLCDKMAGASLKESLQYDIFPDRTVKRRSRRTRMNRSRSIKWKKALIHPVVEGSHKETVGVMVWGQSGPEYYSKLSNKKGFIPFRKTRSFPDEPTKSYSYDMPFNFEPKDVFFSASDPGRKPRSELRTPEEDSKMEEKIANLDKNMEELVKSSKEKFLQSLTKEQFGDFSAAATDKPTPKTAEKAQGPVETTEDTKKHQSLHLMPCELLSSRAPKTLRKPEKTGRDVVAYNVESKTMAESLNERAKQFRLGGQGQKDDFPSKLSELEKKFPPKELDKETMEANLSVWGMKRTETERKELREAQNPAGGEGDGNDLSLNLRIPLRKGSEAEEQEREAHSKTEKGSEEITDAAMEKLSEEMHRERRKKYYEAATAVTKEERRAERAKAAAKSPRRKEDAGEAQSPRSEPKSKGTGDQEQILFDLFKNLVKDGCAISEKESENIQNILNDMRYEAEMNAGEDVTSSEVESKSSCETIRETKEDGSPRYSRYEGMSEKKGRGKDASSALRGKNPGEERQKARWEGPEERKGSKKSSADGRRGEECPSEGISKKLSKLRSGKEDQAERKGWKKLPSKHSDSKCKKRHYNLEKIKLKMIREALPSMAAENEAAHLKQLKKYIHRFIDGVEHKISSSSEVRGGRQIKSKGRDTTSSNSSEVRVDAQKLIDLVSNPFKRITSDVTIDMARKLTDALIQENSAKGPKNASSKARKQSDGSEEESLPCPTSSGSDREDETEPTYLEGLKKMRNDHLCNIMMEVRRLRELIRFLDRCNRLKL